jgi:Protein of unknown function (DUF726)
MRVAGLAPVDCLGDGIENYNVSEFVPGHMSYRTAMPRLLREVGWTVESDEFSEIEDPDPENHEMRQRELINEIEEARKQLEGKQSKGVFGFFKRKKQPEKKDWEVYEDEKQKAQLQQALEGEESKEAMEGNASGVLFDLDALRREVAELAAQGVEVKELPASTLPPIRIDLAASQSTDKLDTGSRSPLRGDSKMSPIAKSASAPSIAEASSSKPGVERSVTQPSDEKKVDRPALLSSATAPVLPPIHLEHNAWADEFEEDFGQEKEISLTFE